MLGAGNTAPAVLAAHQATLSVDRVTVGIPSGIPVNPNCASRFIPAKHAVVRDITPHDRSRERQIGGALGPAAAGEELLNRSASGYKRAKPVVEMHVVAGNHSFLAA